MLSGIGDPTVSGKTLTWSITGTSNGDPGELAVSINGGAAQVIPLSPVGAFTVPFSTTTADFEQDASITVTLRDSSPGNRGSDTLSRRDTSGPPPAPAITLSRNACSDDPLRTDVPDCSSAPPCLVATCGFLVISTTDMTRAYECVVTNSRRPNQSFTLRFDTNGSHETDLVYDEGYVTATCDELGGNRDAGSTTWEWR
jgi:hypothetical protein